jgi:hypothetical protein
MVNLEKMLVYDNPNAKQYRQLAEWQGRSGESRLDHPYVYGWERLIRDDKSQGAEIFRKELRNLLSGKVLIDLGCNHAVTMGLIAKELGASAYIGVDLHYQALQPGRKGETYDPMEFHFHSGDMLEFVSRLTPERINFAINGIDGNVLGVNAEEYSKALSIELKRATLSGSAILVCCSYVAGYLPEAGFQNITPPGFPETLYIRE